MINKIGKLHISFPFEESLFKDRKIRVIKIIFNYLHLLTFPRLIWIIVVVVVHVQSLNPITPHISGNILREQLGKAVPDL